MSREASRTEKEWRKELTEEQYRILRQKGTEAPFSGKYYSSEENGKYFCAACGNEIFSSGAKFDSGSGWPSFYEPVKEGRVELKPDYSLGIIRIEVLCGRCQSHLGHIFNDGPKPTGKRFCVNSISLDFKKEEPEK